MKFTHLEKHLSITLSTLLLTSSVLLAEEGKEISTKFDSLDIIACMPSCYLQNNTKSIQFFNENFIADAQLQSIEDIINFSLNTIYTGNYHGRIKQMSMRGFSGVPILIDGLKVTNAINNSDIFNKV